MKKNHLLLTLATSLLIACGGGGGGGDAAEGGFQQEQKPSITVTWSPETLIPNGSASRFESLSSKAIAMVDVTVMRGNLPLETGTGDSSEVYVSVLNSGLDARLYCFDAGNDNCKETITDDDGNSVEVQAPLSGINVNLNNGQGTFAVTPITGQTGYIDLRVSAAASTSSVAVETVRIPVKYASSGNAYQLNINAPNVVNPNVANKFSVTAFDEAGNPIADSDADNLIVTASNLNGVTLGANGETGSSILTQTESGTAIISLLAQETGFVRITAQADASDNNIENGIAQLVEATKIIQVDANTIIPLEPINITAGTLPNGAVNVAYDFTIPTTGVALTSMTVESGSVPPGLTLSLDGQLAGTPILAGDYSFTVEATGVDGTTSTKTLTVKIVEGGLKFNPTAFENLQIGAEYECVVTSQAVTVESTNSNYTPATPFKWHYDAGNVQTAIDAGTATTLRDANNKELTGLYLTVTADTTQMTMNGEACRSANITGGYGIILGIEDANGIKFETVMPLVIGADAQTVTVVELANATVGSQYNASVTGASSVTGLPSGLSFSNGLISGTPAVGSEGSYSPVATLANGTTQTLTLVVNAADSSGSGNEALTLAEATVGQQYNQSIANATSITGTLPAGLTFSNGLISGVPSVGSEGAYSFTANLANGTQQTVSLTVNAISDLTLASGTVGEAYNATIPNASSVSGTLPVGLTRNGATISGTPAVGSQGTYVLTATLTNGTEQTVNLTINTSADGSTSGNGTGGGSLGTVTAGDTYSAVINAQSLVGTIPNGLTFSNNTLSGTLANDSEGTYTFSAVLANDEQETYTLIVKALPVTLTAATVGSEYSVSLPNASSISSGSLPTGLSLSGTTLSGTPEAGSEGSYTFTVTRTDGILQDHNLTVNP